MAEKTVPIDPTKLKYFPGDDISRHIQTLDKNKSYVFMVSDNRLGHKYLIDLPASGTEARHAYIIQTNLGGGTLPTLLFGEWMKKRGNDSVSLENIPKLISNDYLALSRDDQTSLVAETMELNKDTSQVNLDKQKSDGVVTFTFSEYDPKQFQQNVQDLKNGS